MSINSGNWHESGKIPPRSGSRISSKINFVATDNLEIKQPPTKKMWRIILMNCVSLGLIPLSKKIVLSFILPSLNKDEEHRVKCDKNKTFFKINNDKMYSDFRISTSDRAVIDGMAIFADAKDRVPFERDADCSDQKWIVFFGGNLMEYENVLGSAKEYSEKVNANILLFNYRGVGRSKGVPKGPEDLVRDGDACMQFLKSKGVPDKNIILQGHSLGGGVATQVASIHGESPLLNVNSFESLAKVVEEAVPNKLGKIATSILSKMGWEFNSLAAWENVNEKKMVVYHKNDGVIPHEASLYKGLKRQLKEKKEGKISNEQLPRIQQKVGKLIGTVQLNEEPWKDAHIPIFRDKDGNKANNDEILKKIQYVEDFGRLCRLVSSFQEIAKKEPELNLDPKVLRGKLSVKFGKFIELFENPPLRVYKYDCVRGGAESLNTEKLLERYNLFTETLKYFENNTTIDFGKEDLKELVRAVESATERLEKRKYERNYDSLDEYSFDRSFKADSSYHNIIFNELFMESSQTWEKIADFVKGHFEEVKKNQATKN